MKYPNGSTIPRKEVIYYTKKKRTPIKDLLDNIKEFKQDERIRNDVKFQKEIKEILKLKEN